MQHLERMCYEELHQHLLQLGFQVNKLYENRNPFNFQEGKAVKECLILRTVHVDFPGVMTLGGWIDTY